LFIHERFVNKLTGAGLLLVLSAVCGFAQANSPFPDAPSEGSPTIVLAADPAAEPEPSDPPQSSSGEHRHGLIVRSAGRLLEDQKELYLAPFKPGAYKWDLLFLAGTGALIATDRQSSRALPTNHLDLWRNMSNVSLISTGATLGSLWLYGIKTDNPHAKETGELELETLSNTFLIYTPMQFIFGRERPEEATGNGRFFVNRGFNTSFPAGHPMFTWAMASVAAHEYPKPWAQALAYGAATSVSLARWMGREHYASDILVGSALGYLIGTHVFHSHCNPDLSSSCHRKH
jgi:membrane-associated phospholipid phosphatase